MTPAEQAKRTKLGDEIQRFGALFVESRFFEDAFWANLQESASKITGLLFALREGKARYPGLGQARDSFAQLSAAISEARTAFQRDPSEETKSQVYNRLVSVGEEACNRISALAAEVLLRDY